MYVSLTDYLLERIIIMSNSDLPQEIANYPPALYPTASYAPISGPASCHARVGITVDETSAANTTEEERESLDIIEIDSQDEEDSEEKEDSGEREGGEDGKEDEMDEVEVEGDPETILVSSSIKLS